MWSCYYSRPIPEQCTSPVSISTHSWPSYPYPYRSGRLGVCSLSDIPSVQTDEPCKNSIRQGLIVSLLDSSRTCIYTIELTNHPPNQWTDRASKRTTVSYPSVRTGDKDKEPEIVSERGRYRFHRPNYLSFSFSSRRLVTCYFLILWNRITTTLIPLTSCMSVRIFVERYIECTRS